MSERERMPSSREAERALLGSILCNADCLARVADLVKPSDFRHEAHRQIYAAMAALYDSRGDVDLIELRDLMAKASALDSVGGVVYLASLTSPTPDVANVEGYAGIIREKAALRSLIEASNKATRSALDGGDSVSIAAELQAAVAGLGIDDKKASRGIYEVVREVRIASDARVETGQMSGVATGWSGLDGMTEGLPRQSLSVLAAPSSHGKTTFALNLAMNAVESNPATKVTVYSLEMSRQAIADRLRARSSGVFLNKLRAWRFLNEMDRAKALQAEAELQEINGRFFFADRIISLPDMIADARKRKASNGLDLVIVDYLQLIEGDGDERNRERTVNRVAWSLFELAKTLDVAVLALSQVTPAAQNRTSGRLSIDDLRDSKAIGHHARVVLMLQRPWQSNKGDDALRPCQATVQVEKNSEGETGDLPFHFDGSLQTFTEGECDAARCWYARRAVRVS